MGHRRRYVASIAAMILVAGMPVTAAGVPEPSSRTVLASDLEGGMQIIGHLGIPLGELASIKAKVVPSESKEADQYLEVLEVNDGLLSTPMRFSFSVWQWGNLSSSALPLNRVLSLRVYETGGMEGVPQNAMKETTYVATVGWGFSTSVVILYEER